MPADGDRLEVDETDGRFRWRRVAANNHTLCSGEVVHDREDHAWQSAYRSCPDLDPAWVLVPALSRVSLDAVDRLLAADSAEEREAARAELQQQLP